MNKTFLTIGAVVLGGAILVAVAFWDQFRGAAPVVLPPAGDIADTIENQQPEENGELSPGQNNTDFPLQLPDGFSISVFAKNLPGARVMAMDSFGNMWVSQTREGKITLLEVQDGEVAHQTAIFENLNGPHGLAFHPQQDLLLYFAEEDSVSRVPTYSEGPPEKLFDLPVGGGHSTRTIMFAPDNRLLTSVGSSCNVCNEEDWRRAKVLVSDDNGDNLEVFAEGLRNAVFMATNYVTGDIWVTEMGRDNLGDDTPPDEINILQAGGNYGWPYCYGKNIQDPFGNQSCDDKKPSHIDLQAHSAPLGLAFVPEEGWPEEYWHGLLVAYHGSWNRSEPTGYKIMRLQLDAQGNYEGREDFITGWLPAGGQGTQALGRPAGILIQPGGVLYISDDKAGVIYKVVYQGA